MNDLDMLRPQDWTFPVPIAYGPGRLAEIGARCREMQVSNPLIVTDNGSRALSFVRQLEAHLVKSGVRSGLFSEISPNPRDDEIGAGCSVYVGGKHDGITAIGGGSAMDGAKAICLTVPSGADLWDFEYSKPALDITSGFPPLITIPTTAGTGAETESTAMVTHTEKGMKLCVWHPQCKPTLALLDPELTLGLPPHLTAWTGADAMVHAIEAYLVPDFHPMCDGAALEGLSLIANWLPVAVQEPGNLTARGGMLVGSCLAGVSFLKGLGLVHAISHMIGAEYDTQHGLTNAIILPVVLRYNLPGQEAKVIRMAEAMKLSDQTVDGFILGVENILDQISIPKSLQEIGIPLDCARRIAEKAALDSAAETNPRRASIEEISALIDQAITQAR